MLATYIYILSNSRTAQTLESDNQKKLDELFYGRMYDDYDRASNIKPERIPEVMDPELYNAFAYLEQKDNELLPRTKEEVESSEFVYEEPKTLKKRTNGVALIIIIVEIIVVALFVAMLFTLNI